MIMSYVTPMMLLYNGFYLFLLSHAVNSNRLIFDPSEAEIHQYILLLTDQCLLVRLWILVKIGKADWPMLERLFLLHALGYRVRVHSVMKIWLHVACYYLLFPLVLYLQYSHVSSYHLKCNAAYTGRGSKCFIHGIWI